MTSDLATIVDAAGVRTTAATADISSLPGSGHFFWLDVHGGDLAAREPLLRALDLDEATIGWLQRFGQACRMQIGESVRAATWVVGATGGLIELHLLCTPQFVVTVWAGDPRLLDEVRDRFSRRAVGLDGSHYQAAGILLQLLLSTLDEAITELDSSLDEQQLLLASTEPVGRVDPTLRTGHLKLESVWATFDRYASIVRSAVTGIEVVPGMDRRGAAELNDYADLVADVEHRLHQRIQWLTSILREHAAGMEQHQSDQINRLTLVSVIFLPISFVTGFFGMNFDWMIANIGDRRAFVALGVALPVIIVLLTVALFRRRGLLPGGRRRAPDGRPALLRRRAPPTAER